MVVRSKITGKLYDPDDVWYVANVEQVNAYNINGAETEVVDVIYNSRQSNFIFVYLKTEFMNLLYQKWKRGEIGNHVNSEAGDVNDK